MKPSPLFLLLLLAWQPPTALAELTLESLAKQCEGVEPKPTQPAVGILMCASYIAGALDQIILTDGLAVNQGNQVKRTICGSEQGKIEKLSSMVKFAAKEHPEMRRQPARAVVRGLIFGEFKCN